VQCPCQPSQCRRLSRFCLAMSELIPHSYKNCLDGCEENGCGNCWVSGPLEDRHCLCELVVGTSLSLSLSKLSLSL
jgi:hypothetical protein